MYKRIRFSRWLLTASACVVASAAAPAFAQEAADPAVAPPPTPTEVPTESASKRVFTPEDFARYAPKTAYDMLRQVPGFTIREADQERGLGQASENVLINGQRISSKSGGATAESQRISASNVERIELIDAATLGIAGLTGLIANIVVKKAAAGGGQFAYTPNFRAHFTDPLYTAGNISYSGTKGIVQYTLGLESSGGRSGAGLGNGTTISDPVGELIEFRLDEWRANSDQLLASAKLAFDLAGDTAANLTLTGGPDWYDYRETSRRDRPVDVDRLREVHEEQDGWSYELGGDIAFGFGPGQLKLIGLTKYSKEPYVSTAVTEFVDDSDSAGDRFSRTGKNWEHIARAEYGWKGGGADWLISTEAAFNKLDSVGRIFNLDDDEFVEIPFPEGSGKVTEDRYEGLLTWSKSLSDTLSMQLVGGAEYSTLSSQSTLGEQSRSFFRPKGSASLAWKANKNLDVSLKVRRRVGQLNFYDFLASVNLTEGRENAGNINLVPQQSWEVDLQGNWKLGAWGTTQLRLFHRWIEDIIDIIPIGEDGESPGNVDKAVRSGVEWKSTFSFDPIGWKGAKLDSTIAFVRSRLDDPLTGEPRSINGETRRIIQLSLRHDLPGTSWAWGGGFENYENAAYYRLTQRYRVWEGPYWANVFVEHKDVFGMSVRAGVSNILNARSRLERVFYDGRRTDPVLARESRDRLIGPIFSFSVRGKF